MGLREPTPVDQLMLELINRARSNPQQEANRLLGGNLNEGVSPQWYISPTPKQPLAFNPYLIDAAYLHSKWMLDNDVFSHTGVNGTNSQQRMAMAGYQFIPPWGSGENIAWKGTTGSMDYVKFAIDNYVNLFVDYNYPNRSHRVTMLWDEFREVGIASLQGVFTFNRINYNAVVTTQNFAYSRKDGDGAFLTGVIYTDSVVDDDFYTIGEGIGNIRIIAKNITTGSRYETTSWQTGGYSLFLPPGDYLVSFIGNLDQDPKDDIVKAWVTIGNTNIKLDLATDNPLLATGFLNSNNFNNLPSDNTSLSQASIPSSSPPNIYNSPNPNNHLNPTPRDNLNSPMTNDNPPSPFADNTTGNDGNIPLPPSGNPHSPTANNDFLPLPSSPTNSNSPSSPTSHLLPPLLNTPIYRLQNRDYLGSYLFVGEDEANNILRNYPQFQLEGLAFYVSLTPQDGLMPIYRFRNDNIMGTYLFVGEEEANSIKRNYPVFTEEGIAFYVYPANSQGFPLYRFQNRLLPGSYLFTNESEKNYVMESYSDFFQLEGVAFNVVL
ncbi:MAG: CAP domain-containing protein [Geminocystis sp.]|nr:CAP domain-containing protein [Geminocystis sp.]MCS7148749.1 CAP domain-containing protein [Geminocystis sp.]MDW8116102.1 CAP domain-containing protein [Geminocystis sp.]MDW8463558.1 CAP domain-containing protein [Geminocystis sp.]